MKKEFVTSNGSEGMIIDCVEYEVEIFKSKDIQEYGSMIKITDKKTLSSYMINRALFIDWDGDNLGGRLEIKYKDRWGSEMIFKHYYPSDLKGFFDCIIRIFK